MNIINPHSLKARTIVLFAIINVLALVLLARFSYLFVRNLYLQQFQEQMQTSLRVANNAIDRQLLHFLTVNQQSMAHRYFSQSLNRLDSLLSLENAFIFNDRWQVLNALQRADAVAGLLVNKEILRHLKIGQVFITQPFKGDDRQWYLWAFQRLTNEHFIGLRAGAHQLAQINRLSDYFVWFVLVGVVLTLLAGLYIAHSVHAPIRGITLFSQKIGRGDFSAQPPATRLKEIVDLTRALTNMRDALARRDQEKEQLLAQIAHELRNPLGGIELLIGLVKDDLPPQHADQTYLKKALEEVRHLKEQINEFLEYSRPRPADKTEVNLPQLVDELKARFAIEMQKKEVELVTHFKQSALRFDRQHLKHILSNLLANSLQAMNGDPGIIMLRCEQNTLEIEDNGPGIAPENRAKIFQPFFTTKNSGVGLGLTICQKLCALNDATLSLVQNASGGAVFRIQLNTEVS
ncbi:ATP-binding protein [Caldithrix abyssi]